MGKKNILITAALPYVNNYPHLGNIIGSILSADVYAKFLRLYYKDRKILFVCGTDEHGTPIELEARKIGCTPIELCDKYYSHHKEIYEWFNVQFDYFGRTTAEDHKILTQEIFHNLKKNGFFYEKSEERPYCNTCENFLADRFIKGTCYSCGKIASGDQCDSCTILIETDRLKDIFCAICKNTTIERRSTSHFYLKLNELKADVEKKLKFDCLSQNAQRITRDWLNRLHDRPMSRDLRWGIPVPGTEGKVFYVWFDAPIAYITFANAICTEEIFKSNDWSIRQFMGKDNVIFHSLIFPAICLGSQYENIVSHISSTEYLMYNGEKFSKSNRVGIFGSDLIGDQLGSSDFFRFYLLKIRPEKSDSNFSVDEFLACTNNFQNTFCNLVSRIIKYLNKRGGEVIYKESGEEFSQFTSEFNLQYREFLRAFEQIEIRRAVELFLSLCGLLNNFIQQHINDKERRDSVFNFAFSPLIVLIVSASPFVPGLITQYKKIINYDFKYIPEELHIVHSHKINYEGEVFFKKLNEEQIANLKKFS